MQQANLPEAIRSLMERDHVSQATIAKAASVSQPTVSRAAKRQPVRHSAAAQKLFTYIQQAGPAASPPSSGEQLVLIAFDRIWDRSDAHASAVAKIISATEDLRPISKEHQ